MPIDWTIPYIRSKSKKDETNVSWTSLPTTSGIFSFSKNDTYSSQLKLTSEPAIGASLPRLITFPGVVIPKTSSTTVEWINLTTFDPATITANDLDGDGLSNTIEIQMGFDPLKKNSDFSGYNDRDELNASIWPVPDQLLVSTRMVDYRAFRPGEFRLY